MGISTLTSQFEHNLRIGKNIYPIPLSGQLKSCTAPAREN